MTTPIKNPSELQELLDLLAEHGLHVRPDVKNVEELVRDLLTACKTRAATLAIMNKERAAKAKGRNPDAPDSDDEGDISFKDAAQAASSIQMSTAGDRRPRYRDEAERAKRLVDASERHRTNPNFAADPFAD